MGQDWFSFTPIKNIYVRERLLSFLTFRKLLKQGLSIVELIREEKKD